MCVTPLIVVSYSPLFSYKQNKFNLSREETLGFSKLVAEIIANAFEADARKDEKEDVNYDDLIKVVLRNISSLIGMSKGLKSDIFILCWHTLSGSFHLDPNRVLDILLDIFIDQVKYNYKFFIQLLKQSPWIPATADNDGDIDMSNGLATQSQTPCPLISHLLGFKFRFYQVRYCFDWLFDVIVFMVLMVVKVTRSRSYHSNCVVLC
jgi:THO complex subunit 2